MGRVAEVVDPYGAHISNRGGQHAARTTSAESTRRHWPKLENEPIAPLVTTRHLYVTAHNSSERTLYFPVILLAIRLSFRLLVNTYFA